MSQGTGIPFGLIPCRGVRRYFAPPLGSRCMATVTRSDGSTAQCMRRRDRSGAIESLFCWQHNKERVALAPNQEGA